MERDVDYSRIYSEFIADRKRLEAVLTGYVERHHILPRCMGGGDEAENLIRLTPEDHFFAHLLLAKVHGGKLWAPIAFMVSGQRKDYRPIESRRAYGWVARAMARAKSGDRAPQLDCEIYRLSHRDGRAWSGRQIDMYVHLGMSRSAANQLIKRRIGTVDGWFLAGTAPRFRGDDLSGARHPMYRGEAHSFLHPDGRTFRGTQFDLHLTHGVSKSAACNLARGKVASANGWHLEGTELPTRGRGARWRKAA